jgi:hypothetical protein
LKFLANMGISPLTVAFLRTLGHEAKHLHEEGLDRLPDEEIMEEGALLSVSEKWIRVRRLPL